VITQFVLVFPTKCW